MPQFQISTIPLNKKFIDAMNLPGVTMLVRKALNTIFHQLIAPHCMTINAGKLISGLDTTFSDASAIVAIFIDSAVNVPQRDQIGTCDPYVSVSFSQYSKPLYRSRILKRQRDPMWKEWCFIVVCNHHLRSRENIRLTLWNSNRFTPDQLIGVLEFNLRRMAHHPNCVFSLNEPMIASGDTNPPELICQVGYFPTINTNTKMNKESSSSINRHCSTDRNDNIDNCEDTNDNIKSSENMPLNNHLSSKTNDPIGAEKPAADKSNRPAQISSTTAVSEQVSGVLTIEIHQIVDLKLAPTQKTFQRHNLMFFHGDLERHMSDDPEHSPSAYCNVILNGIFVHRTRTKPISASPIFNAKLDVFVRDWRDSEIIVSVRDRRMQEDDPIIGIVYTHLFETFAGSFRTSQWIPIHSGIGYGKMKLSLLFQPTQISLPRELRTWSLGVIEISDGHILVDQIKDNFTFGEMRVSQFIVSTHSTTYRIMPYSASRVGPRAISWHIGKMHFALTNKFVSSLRFRFRSGLRSTTTSVAALWCCNLRQDEIQHIELPLWTSRKIGFISNNILGGDPSPEMMRKYKLVQIARISFNARFVPGATAKHDKLDLTRSTQRQVYESFKRSQTARLAAKLRVAEAMGSANVNNKAVPNTNVAGQFVSNVKNSVEVAPKSEASVGAFRDQNINVMPLWDEKDGVEVVSEANGSSENGHVDANMDTILSEELLSNANLLSVSTLVRQKAYTEEQAVSENSIDDDLIVELPIEREMIENKKLGEEVLEEMTYEHLQNGLQRYGVRSWKLARTAIWLRRKITRRL